MDENIYRPENYIKYLNEEIFLNHDKNEIYLIFLKKMLINVENYYSYLISNKDLEILYKHILEYMYFKSNIITLLDYFLKICNDIDEKKNIKYIEYIFFETDVKDF